MPLEESLSIMRTLDEIRAQWGLQYPVESGMNGSQTAGGWGNGNAVWDDPRD